MNKAIRQVANSTALPEDRNFFRPVLSVLPSALSSLKQLFYHNFLFQAFFITPTKKKTKTQGKKSSHNSRKKLNLWGALPLLSKNSTKNMNFQSKNQNFK